MRNKGSCRERNASTQARLHHALAGAKQVTHNETLRRLDVVVQLSAADRDRASPPAETAGGERHIVAPPANGDWTGHENDVAAYQDGTSTVHPIGADFEYEPAKSD